MKNIPLLIGTILGSLLLVGVLAFFFSGQGANPVAVAPVEQSKLTEGARLIKTTEAMASPSASPNPSASPSASAPTAAVTIVEFSDFQCPACKAAQPMIESVLKQYGDKVTLIYRHYPLDQLHPNARLAAQAAEVAFDQGKFWQFHDALFNTQEEWAKISDKSALLEYFTKLATQLKLDTTDFASKVESQAIADRVKADSVLGNSINIQATPTFFVNGQSVTAPQLSAAVEHLVAP